MKAVLAFSLLRSSFHSTAFLTAVATGLVGEIAAVRAAPSTVQMLLPGKWPVAPSSQIIDVKVVGNYAYLADAYGDFSVVDVSIPCANDQFMRGK